MAKLNFRQSLDTFFIYCFYEIFAIVSFDDSWTASYIYIYNIFCVETVMHYFQDSKSLTVTINQLNLSLLIKNINALKKSTDP